MRRPHRCVAWLCALAALLPLSAAAAQKARIDWLEGDRNPETVAYPSAISGDGRFVVGSRRAESVFRGFRWTQAGGLARFDLDVSKAYPLALSRSGKIAVGSIELPARPGNPIHSRAFRWKKKKGLDKLPTDSVDGSFALAVSGDGVVAAGGHGGRAASWIGSAKPTIFGPPGLRSYATAISTDGGTLAGDIRIPGGDDYEAFVWTADRGIRRLGFLPGHVASRATDISGDGATVVGTSYDADGGSHVFLWTEPDGMEEIAPPDPKIGGGSEPAIADDGSRVAFASSDGPLPAVIVWDAANGARSLATVLREVHGVELPEAAYFRDVAALSEDGTAIVGSGWHPKWLESGFRARLPR